MKVFFLLQSIFSSFLCRKINNSIHIYYEDLTPYSRICKPIGNLVDNTLNLVVLYNDFHFYPRNKFWSKMPSTSINSNRLCFDFPSAFNPRVCHSTFMCLLHYFVHIIKQPVWNNNLNFLHVVCISTSQNQVFLFVLYF